MPAQDWGSKAHVDRPYSGSILRNVVYTLFSMEGQQGSQYNCSASFLSGETVYYLKLIVSDQSKPGKASCQKSAGKH